MSKYTPGPWYADAPPILTIGGKDFCQDWYVHNKAKVICSFPVNFSTPETGANARLIAAAPDMLETLEFLINTHTFSSSTHEMLEAVIEKATGKTKE